MAVGPDVSIVVPIYNEAENIPELERRLRQTLTATGVEWEIVFVNDGSRDASLDLLKRLQTADHRIGIVDFSRNFGHQVAVTAGIDHSSGRAGIVMDGDLQDPPEVLPGLLERWRQGYDVVYAVRRNRKESAIKRLAYTLFYRIIRRLSDVELPLDSGDFALMDRRVAALLSELPERNRYVRGLRAWLGFRQIGYEYDRDARFAGAPKYTLRRLVKLAFDGIVSFSDAPLRMARHLGLVITGVSGLLGLWTLAKRLLFYEVVPGFATVVLLIVFFGGIQLVTIGVLGEYIGRIYGEVKGRPRYVIRDLYGLEPTRHRHGLPTDEVSR